MLLFGDKDNQVNRVNWMAMPFSLSFSGDVLPVSFSNNISTESILEIEKSNKIALSNLVLVEADKNTYISTLIGTVGSPIVLIENTIDSGIISKSVSIEHGLEVSLNKNIIVIHLLENFLLRNFNVEFIRGVSANNTFQLEFNSTFNLFRTSILEYILRIEADEKAIVEAIILTSGDHRLSIGYLISLGILHNIPIEWVIPDVLNISKIAQIEYIREFNTTGKINQENNIEVIRLHTINNESLIGVSSNFAPNIEFLLNHSFGKTALIEFSSLLQHLNTIRLENRLDISANENLIIEHSILSQIISSTQKIEYLGSVLSQKTIYLSYLVDLILDKSIVLDHNLGILIDKDIVLEYIASAELTNLSKVLYLESLVGVNSPRYIRIEWLGEDFAKKILSWILGRRDTEWSTKNRESEWNLLNRASSWNIRR